MEGIISSCGYTGEVVLMHSGRCRFCNKHIHYLLENRICLKCADEYKTVIGRIKQRHDREHKDLAVK